ncbi:MAG: hypothetical protein RLZZ215_1353 [Pseudomonadota bacterium]|jgi:GTPase Era involved in 16S rRNA processing
MKKVAPDGTARPFGDSDFELIASQSRGARATQAGCSTLKRAVVSASILSGQGQAAWNAILGNFIRQSGQQLTTDEPKLHDNIRKLLIQTHINHYSCIATYAIDITANNYKNS